MTETKVRAGHRSVATKTINQINGLFDQSPLDSNEIRAKIVILKMHFDKIVHYDELIQIKLDENALIADMEDSSDRISAIQKTIIATEQRLAEPTVHSGPNHGGSIGLNSKTQLPKISLLYFDGNPINWPQFWDNFDSAVHSRNDLTNVQKFNYFMGQLKDEAAQLLEGFKLTNDNYDEAISLAKETFGKPDRIIRSHLHALFDLPNPDPSAAGLRKFRSSYESHLRALKTLGTKVDEAGFVITALLLRKLPNRIKDNINRSSTLAIFELVDFRKCINNEIDFLQALVPEEHVGLSNHKNTAKHNPLSNVNRVQNPTGAVGGTGSTVGSFVATEVKPNSGMKFAHKDTYNKVRSHEEKSPNCRFCDGNHFATNCEKYKTADTRFQLIKSLALCHKCFSKNHFIANCSSKQNCFYCKGNHHSALCRKKFGDNKDSYNVKHETVVANSISTNVTPVALPVAVISIDTCNGVQQVKGLFDQCSQRTFLLERVAQQLNLKPCYATNITIDGFTSKGMPEKYDVVQFDVVIGDVKIKIEAILVDKMPDRVCVPGLAETTKKLKRLNINLANPVVEDDYITDLSLLVGCDQYYNFVTGHYKVNGINMVQSSVGDMIVGRLPVNQSSNHCSTDVVTVLNLNCFDTLDEISIDKGLQAMWTLDSVGIGNNEFNRDEVTVLNDFESSLSYSDRKYTVKLPWKYDNKILSSNYGLAKSRLYSLLNSLKDDGETLTHYNKVIGDYLDRNFIEKVESKDSRGNRVHYLPHHFVRKDSPTTPLRVVFDCSARTSKDKASLNDCLFSGPSLINDLVDVLMRFRVGKYASTSDIAKAFLMIQLNESDRDVTRFFWPENPFDVTNSKLNIYRFKVVLFGATCSQFLLNATINHHLKLNPSELSSKIQQGLYVDNVIGNFDNECDILSFYENSKEFLGDAGLNLREWCTNSPMLKQKIGKVGDNVTMKDNQNEVNVLGLKWNFIEDKLTFANRDIDVKSKATKRVIISNVSKIFDPLGLLTPVTISSRIFIQKLWKQKIEWDEYVGGELDLEWKKLAAELQSLAEAKFPRNIFTDQNFSLHAFCDASALAYGAVVYVVNGTEANILISKARVAPLKLVSIPRLELMAATLASRLISYVVEAFSMSLEPEDVHMWTDSQVVLHWLASNKSLDVFTRNRVNEIKDLVRSAKWHFVSSGVNPADLLSRGVSFSLFSQSSLWAHGPNWLCDSHEWPVWDPSTKENCSNNSFIVATEKVTSNFMLNAKPIVVKVNVINEVPVSDEYLIDFSRFCTLKKLLNCICCVFKFVDKVKRIDLNDDVDYLKKAEEWLIKSVQNKYYSKEISWLRAKSGTIPNSCKQLNLILVNDILHCQGRITHSELNWETKNPLLLPSKDPVTNLIIEDAHEKRFHGGVNDVVSFLRQRWWIPQVRQRVKGVLRGCILCKKLQGHSFVAPMMPPLPACRVQEARPFQVCGIDYTGALTVKNKAGLTKAYVVLFTCAVTRAVHLEVVEDNSVEAFIRAFRKFSSRRSCPHLILSDNASTFVSSAVNIKEIQNHPMVKNILFDRCTKWKFIPARAPWFGGFWERLIGLMKMAIKKSLGRALVSLEELQTIIVEIEAGLNDRPLTYASGDLNDPTPVTPSQLLCGYRLDVLPSPIEAMEDDYDYVDKPLLNKRQLKCAQVLDSFWLRWRNEYLTSLRERQKSVSKKVSLLPKVGDIVQVYDESPRMHWKLGRITEIHYGIDGCIRSAKVLVNNKELTRSITHLYPLEINADDSNCNNVFTEDEEPCDFEGFDIQSKVNLRPRRKAALVQKAVPTVL